MAADPPSSDAATEFVGRGWLADTVRDWAETGSPYLFLTGGPGTGKSAAVEHLWGGGPAAGTAVHRRRAASPGSCDPVRFAESLAEQFSTTVPGFAEALKRVARELSGRPGDLRIEGTASAGTVHPHASLVGVRISLPHVPADEAFEQLVCRPLELLAPAQRPVAVVDALDEALTYRGRRTIAELVLAGTDRLPLRFVLTSRHDARVTAAVRHLPDAVVVDVVDDAPDPAADLLAYAHHRLRRTPLAGPRREELAHRLAAAGKGNYLYVRHFTEELSAGTRTAEETAAPAPPNGLDGICRQFLQREIRPVGSADAEERRRVAFRPVLALLVAAREDGCTAGRLADLLDRTEQEVLDTVRVLGQYLRGGGPRGPWTLFHRSFEEFLISGGRPLPRRRRGPPAHRRPRVRRMDGRVGQL
ncbi:ATP-binding protein [Streptomyces sp. H27-S2]|uniref:ATP-binding protein n=1 Tax=Streptomyces antarcticus TaxID=2996458 RepID=UPI002271D043|nr:ATP-binding protein [Streptomyces sp. H27-S2]MCY0951481.1 ATP-binding protein [Streptomyces sp. H27-S2]